MSVLQIIAEQRLGKPVLKGDPSLALAFDKIEARSAKKSGASDDDKERIAAIVELCFEYEREKDEDERRNILRTLHEIATNAPLEMPKQTLEEWEKTEAKNDSAFATLQRSETENIQRFLKKYFSLRAKAGLKTQTDVAKATGLARAYVAVLESGKHAPQQKTLQKLAAAFQVDVTELM